MKLCVLIVIFSCVAWSILGQQDQQFTGTCPPVTTKNITEKEYAGKWYEIQKFNNTLIPGDCGAPNYVLVSTGFNVTFDWKNLVQNKTYTTKVVHKRQVIGPVPGKYDVYVDNKKDLIPEFILDTDYKTYSVAFGCVYNSTKKLSTQRATIYSRQKTLNQTILTKATDVLKKFKIDSTKLRNVEQDDKKCGRK